MVNQLCDKNACNIAAYSETTRHGLEIVVMIVISHVPNQRLQQLDSYNSAKDSARCTNMSDRSEGGRIRVNHGDRGEGRTEPEASHNPVLTTPWLMQWH